MMYCGSDMTGFGVSKTTFGLSAFPSLKKMASVPVLLAPVPPKMSTYPRPKWQCPKIIEIRGLHSPLLLHYIHAHVLHSCVIQHLAIAPTCFQLSVNQKFNSNLCNTIRFVTLPLPYVVHDAGANFKTYAKALDEVTS